MTDKISHWVVSRLEVILGFGAATTFTSKIITEQFVVSLAQGIIYAFCVGIAGGIAGAIIKLIIEKVHGKKEKR